MTPTAEHTDEHKDATLSPAAPSLADDSRAPIFILGIMPRSGTNFLHRLLCQHPACGATNTPPVREDYMVHHATWLARYLGRLRWQWGHWGADDKFVEPLANHVGNGLTTFLQSLTDAQRFVTKTPSVANLKAFFKYFPHAYLLIIVRDGRSLVASGMNGFGWNFETATRQWAKSARSIITFLENNTAYADRFKVVKYEQLNADTVGQMEEVLSFLNLDVSQFDFDAALDTPVYGSSFMKQNGDQVTWKPQEKKKDFNAGERWSSWSSGRHKRFNGLAGRELKALGYEPVGDMKGDGLKDAVLDALYSTRTFPHRFLRAARAGVKAFRKDLQGKGQGNRNLKR